MIYSRTFNGSYPAFASWAWFADRRTGTRLRVVNVHLDFRSAENRLRSAALIADRLRPWLDAGEPVVLAGDLNAMAGSRTARILTDAGLILTPARGSSYHFNRGLNLFGAIDHVLHDCTTRLTDRPVAIRERPEGNGPPTTIRCWRRSCQGGTLRSALKLCHEAPVDAALDLPQPRPHSVIPRHSASALRFPRR
ncbi:endonuclease/exonuclease/phosphatase family protein [Paracoccus marcusii]|uniref:endonuclease/exonuclease/phosphatase family protein n=1 Tax=Paracoccus marcusii TaxID=59779 RepID=UPI002ED56829|nr:endonuclease/exonuclease/phosphatase family protein [Paracoccus marcusii]